MPLHLLKLCVGAESIDDLKAWIAERLAVRTARGEASEHLHRTRMVPRRSTELLDGGSMFWIIKGQIAARQFLRDVRPFVDETGVARCHIVMDPNVVAVMPRPHRPFQGWRYLKHGETPDDLTRGRKAIAKMPETLRRELRELGLL